MRSYETSHPWIQFSLNLSGIKSAWIVLGEISGKCSLLNDMSLNPDNALHLYHTSLAQSIASVSPEKDLDELIELVQNASATGNTGIAGNSLQVINELVKVKRSGSLEEISVESLRAYNKNLLDGTDLQADVVPGEFRNVPAGPEEYIPVPPDDCEFLMEKLIDWLNTAFAPPSPQFAAVFGLLKAVTFSAYMYWINPFAQGNAETTQVAERHILLKAGLPLPATNLLSSLRNRISADFDEHLKATIELKGNILKYINFVVNQFLQEVDMLLYETFSFQSEIIWTDFLARSLDGQRVKVIERQQKLVNDIMDHGAPVNRDDIREISPDLWKKYREMNKITLRRDLESLTERGVLRKSERGYTVDKSALKGFSLV